MRIDIKITDFERVKDLMDAYPERVKLASRRAVNRAADGLKSEAGKTIMKAYAIKTRDLKAAITKKTAKGKHAEAEVTLFRRFMPLDKFAHRPTRPGAKTPKEGIRVRLKRGSGSVYAGTFLGRGRAGDAAAASNGFKIFKRVGKERLPIKRLFGPAVSQMLDEKDIAALRISAAERYFKAFEHEMTAGFKYGGLKKRN